MINGVRRTRYSHAKEWNQTPILHYSQKLGWNGLGLNVRPATVKQEESIGKNFLALVLTTSFFVMITKAQATKAKINKWDCTKIKRSCTAKEIINKMKKQPMEWKKIFANHISDKELISKYIRNSLSSIAKNQIIQFKDGQRTSLVIQWVRLHTPNTGGLGSIPGQGTRSCMPQLKSSHATTKKSACCN